MKTILSRLTRKNNVSSNSDYLSTQQKFCNTSKRLIDSKHSKPNIIDIAYSANNKLIEFLQKVLDEDGKFRNGIRSKMEIKESGDELLSIKAKHELAFSIMKKSLSGDKNSFYSIFFESDVAKKNILTNAVYAFFIIRILHLNFIDYQHLMNKNREETTKLCKGFLIENFNHHILDTIMTDEQNESREFSNRLMLLRGCLTALPRKGDCTLWLKATKSFETEIVRYDTNKSSNI